MNETTKKAIGDFKNAFLESEELKEYNAAKAAYEGDGELMRLVNEYNLQSAILEQESSKPEPERDAELLKSIADRLCAVYADLEKSPLLGRMRAAEAAIAEVFNEVSVAMRLAVNPESEQNCTHDCSTCGGCR